MTESTDEIRAALTQQLSELELKIVSKTTKSNQALYDMGIRKEESMKNIK